MHATSPAAEPLTAHEGECASPSANSGRAVRDVLDRIEGDVAAASAAPEAVPQQRSRVVEIPPAAGR